SAFLCLDPATHDIDTLSLHDALPISLRVGQNPVATKRGARETGSVFPGRIVEKRSTTSGVCRVPIFPEISPSRFSRSTAWRAPTDRKSTRLNSSHVKISYAVLCLKKK